MIDWSKVFDKKYPESGATEEECAHVMANVRQPLSKTEIEEINRSGLVDAGKWKLPQRPLPLSYLSFLRWSNGGSFGNGDRMFDPFFSADVMREYLLAYQIPEYMPGALQFAFDGGGGFYLFDMRRAPISDEYPVVWADAGALDWAIAKRVAATFLEACQGRVRPSKIDAVY